MKFWKHTFVAMAAFVGIGSTVLYTSCEKDSCLELRCLNGGACSDGFCRCPSGFEGPTCETRVVDKFPGRYMGENRCVQDTTEYPKFIDTVDIYLRDSVTLAVVQRSNAQDTFFGKAMPIDSDLGVAIRTIEFPDDSSTVNFVTKVSAELDEAKKRLTFYTQRTNLTTGVKVDCKFLGFK